MSPVYATVKLYIDLDGDNVTETNISNRIVSPFDGQHGIFSYRDTERISNIGNVSFDIDNADGTYTDSESLIGHAISIRLLVGTREKQIFYGYIEKADLDPAEWGTRRVRIRALDWVNVASKSRVKNIALATFVTADEAFPTLLDATVNPPAYTSFENGFERFPNMYDGALRNTTVYSELDKIVKSELGNLYLRFRPSEDGETLTFENYLHRGSKHELSKVPKDVETPFFLKKHGDAGNNGYLKFHGNSGTSGKIKLAQAQQAYFDRTMIDSEWEIGLNVVNQMSVNNIPRDTDSTSVVLYNLSSPIRVGTNQTFTIDGSYTDPNGGTLIQAFDVATTGADFLWEFNSASDGTGTDLKALGGVQINFVGGTNSFTVTILNSSVVGYLTLLTIKGKGIYKYSQIETLRENTESQEEIVKNVIADSITREYSNDYNVSESFSNGVLAIDRTPRKVMKSVSFLANISEHLMMAFMYLEQGDKVQIVESNPSHTGNYYIQGVKFKIEDPNIADGVVYFTWYLKEADETIAEPIAIRTGTNSAGNRSAINFGILPYMANMPRFSYSFWVKRLGFSFAVLLSRSVDTGSGRRGNFVILNTNGDVEFYSYKTPTDGAWEAALAVSGTNTWRHVVITYENTTDVSDPKMYVDGSAVTVTETSTPSGSSDDDSDCPLVLFNTTPNPAVPNQQYFYDSLRNVVMKDVRVYSKILTSAEITELYNGEDDYSTVQDGLLFQGIYAPTENINDYINDIVEDQDLIIDSVHRATGTPYNEDVSANTETLYGLSL